MALRYLRDGWDIIGTYRNPEHVAALTDRPGVTLVQCDPGENGGLAPLTQIFADKSLTWDLFFSSVGTMEPIGPFFETDFDAWERSVVLNTTAQLRALHMLHRFRRPEMAHVCFLAGGGTNGPFRNYSANCVSKIALIKMCELLHDESPDLNVFIVGPDNKDIQIRGFIVQQFAHLDQGDFRNTVGRIVPEWTIRAAACQKTDMRHFRSAKPMQHMKGAKLRRCIEHNGAFPCVEICLEERADGLHRADT